MKFVKRAILTCSVFLLINCSDEKDIDKTDVLAVKQIGQVLYNPFQSDYITLTPYISSDLQIYNSNEIIVGNRNHPDNKPFGDYMTDYVYFTSFNNILEKNFEKYPVGNLINTTIRSKLKVINGEIYLLYAFSYDLYTIKTKLLKLNSDGNVLFDYPLLDNLDYTDIIIIDNKFYLVSAGFGISNYADEIELGLTILDKNGNILNTIFYKDYNYSSNIITVNNQLFISSTKFIEYNINKPVVLKTDLKGNFISETAIDNFEVNPTSILFPYYIRKGTDAIYSVSKGYSYSTTNVIAKLDFSGQIIWNKSFKIDSFPYRDFEFIEDFELDNSNNLYLFGSVNEQVGFGPRRIAIAKYNSKGNFVKSYIHKKGDEPQWGKCLEIYNDEIFTTAWTSPLGGIILTKFDLNLNVK